jgi:3-phenylpropionate/trans-cinnamate dioxygenase ferredoxin reductase subunit
MEDGSMVIVGAGLAGDVAAEQLRKSGWQGRIVLIGDEPHRPYDRPPLSKAALASADADERLFYRTASWYQEQGVELRLGEAVRSIDLEARCVVMPSGERVSFGKLLIATGAAARRLPLLEAGPAPVCCVRSLHDARKLRALLRPGVRVVVAGGGVIGLEIAASATRIGCAVTVVEAAPRVMARTACPTLSAFLADRHRSYGVRLVVGAQVAGVRAEGSASRLLLSSGASLTADVVVAGVGARPNTELAEAAGLRVDDGVLVDAATRTSHPDVHAAGDVARFAHAGGVERAEHWRHASEHAAVAARAMAGEACEYRPSPWLWSEQYDLDIQITGRGAGRSDVLRGRLEDGAFTIFHLDDGRVVGATSVNQGRHRRQLAQLVGRRAAIDPAVLQDAAVEMKTLLDAAA